MRVIGVLFSNSPTGFGQAYINVVGNYTIAGLSDPRPQLSTASESLG